MKKAIGVWQLMGFAITSLGGTVLHFLYDKLNNATWIAPFSSVNESTWEHMKLFFWPAFIFAIFQSFFFKDAKSFWGVKLKGILLGLLLIPVLFYSYNGVIGVSPNWINIAIFFISAASAYYCEYRQFKSDTTSCKRPNLAFFTICILAILFVLFTFNTPELGIFKDPITNSYGI